MATNLTPHYGLDVGDRRTATATFRDDDGEPATVLLADVTCTVVKPDGTTSTVDPEDVTVVSGVVSHEVAIDQAGTWWGRIAWQAAGGAEAQEWRFKVRVPMALATT